MSKYKQLTAAYALNHEALFAYRTEVRDAAVKVCESLKLYLGVPAKDLDHVSITALDGGTLFPEIAALEHGDNLRLNVSVHFGSDLGGANSELPNTTFTLAAEISKERDDLVFSVARLNLHQVLTSDESYQVIAESIFNGMLEKLNAF